MFAVLLSSLFLAATDPTPVATPRAAEPAKSDKTEVVCHHEKPTGSHFIERVCVTRAEADRAAQAAQDTMTKLNSHPKAAEKPAK